LTLVGCSNNADNLVALSKDRTEYPPKKLNEIEVGETVKVLAPSMNLDKDGKCWLWMHAAVQGPKSPYPNFCIIVTKKTDGYTVVIPKHIIYKWEIDSKWVALKYEPVKELIEEK